MSTKTVHVLKFIDASQYIAMDELHMGLAVGTGDVSRAHNFRSREKAEAFREENLPYFDALEYQCVDIPLDDE